MAYFGDTLAHASLLGVALGLFLQINPWLTVMVGSVLLGVLLMLLQNSKTSPATPCSAFSPTAPWRRACVYQPDGQPAVGSIQLLLGDLLTATRSEALTMAG